MANATIASLGEPTRSRSFGARLRELTLGRRTTRRALVAYLVALALWQLGSTSKSWLGVALPLLGHLPAPTEVLVAWAGLLTDVGYWQSWYLSLGRVLLGFGAAVIVGVPFGLFMAVSPS
jgi:sulfonate transport system permease protein